MSGTAESHGAPLSNAILQHVAADWPEFARIRASARALSQKTRLAHSVSIAANEVRVAMASALLSHDCGTRPPTAVSAPIPVELHLALVVHVGNRDGAHAGLAVVHELRE